MSLFNYNDDEVSLDELKLLIQNQTSEKRTIDYKLNLILDTDENKKEFLADVTSFANTDGGVIIYGMKEDNALPVELFGLKSDNKDILKGKIESIIRDGIEPKLNKISVVEIPTENEDKFVIVLKIPKSWSSPHLVWYKRSSKFFARNSSHGKYQLDVNEIRTHFLFSDANSQQIRNFRFDRISKIINGEAPITLISNPKFIMHIIPVSSFQLQNKIPTQKLISVMRNPGPLHDYKKLYNFEGLLFHNQFDIRFPAEKYIQVFRTGIIELLNADFTDVKENEKIIFGKRLEYFYINQLPVFFNLLKFFEIGFPIIILLSVVGIKNYKFDIQDRYGYFNANYPIKSENLLIPDMLLEEKSLSALDTQLKQIFDPIWNSAGFSGSIYYNASNKWTTK
jgi:hypothetical protein